MITPGAIEEAALALLCFSSEHAPLLSLKFTDYNLFSNRTNKLLAQTSIDYVKKYARAPQAQLEYLLEHDLLRGEEGRLLDQQIKFLAKQVTQLDPQFILEQIDNYLEIQKLSLNLQNALETLGEGDLDKAKSILQKNEIKIDTDEGIWIHDTKKSLAFFERDEFSKEFSSGIDVLDAMNVRPDRKTIMFMIASSGKGKSWWGISVGKAALQNHQKVLHITLELSAEKTAKRYVQSIFSLTQRDVETIKVPFFPKDDRGNTIIQYREFQRDPLLSKRNDIQKRLQSAQHYQLLIKEFPTGSLSTEHLHIYIDSLEREKGFKPDILILDYADLMKIDSASLRVDTGRLYRDLRGMAMAKNFALVTMTQGNRESENAKLVDRTNVAEDWSKIGTGDTIVTYSQTTAEFGLGLARLFVTKARDTDDRFLTLISQNYKIGQFALDSTPMTVDLANQLA